MISLSRASQRTMHATCRCSMISRAGYPFTKSPLSMTAAMAVAHQLDCRYSRASSTKRRLLNMCHLKSRQKKRELRRGITKSWLTLGTMQHSTRPMWLSRFRIERKLRQLRRLEAAGATEETLRHPSRVSGTRTASNKILAMSWKTIILSPLDIKVAAQSISGNRMKV